MASSEKKNLYSVWHVIWITVLTGLFVALGTYVLIDLLARVLPSTEINVQIVDRSSKKSYHYIAQGSISLDLVYRVTVQDENGTKRTITVPKKLYDRALPGLGGLMSIQLTLNNLFGRPVAMSVNSSTGSLIKPGSALDKLINAGAESSRSEKEPEQYSLLVPLVGAVFGLALFWLVAAFIIWKIPSKSGFHWPLFTAGMLAAIMIGATWY